MNKDKKLFISIFVIIILIIMVCCTLILINNKSNNVGPNATNTQIDMSTNNEKYYSDSLQKSNIEDDLLTIDRVEKLYFKNINDDTFLKDICNFEQEKSVIDQCRQIAKNSTKFNYYTAEVYTATVQSNNIYYTQGVILTNNNEYKIYMKAVIDVQNGYTYMLENISKSQYENEIKEFSTKQATTIAKNNNNSFATVMTTKAEQINRYFNYFYDYACIEPQKAYDMLNKEYAKKRFGTVQKFEEYIQNAQNDFQNFDTISYTPTADGSSYTVQNFNQKNYVIKINGAMDFEIQLDDYTLETDSFIQKYNNASDETKVKTNVEKFLKMISNYDYDGAYNLLDATYKNNNFKTVDSYKQYITTHFYTTNFYSIDNITMQGSYYIVKLTTKQDARLSANSATSQIIVALGDKTDFTMSISL